MYKERLLDIQAKDYSWVNEDKIKDYLLASRDNLDNKDKKLQRKVIETFVEKIVINNDKIDATFKLELLESGKVGGGEPCLTLSLSVKRSVLFAI